MNSNHFRDKQLFSVNLDAETREALAKLQERLEIKDNAEFCRLVVNNGVLSTRIQIGEEPNEPGGQGDLASEILMNRLPEPVLAKLAGKMLDMMPEGYVQKTLINDDLTRYIRRRAQDKEHLDRIFIKSNKAAMPSAYELWKGEDFEKQNLGDLERLYNIVMPQNREALGEYLSGIASKRRTYESRTETRRGYYEHINYEPDSPVNQAIKAEQQMQIEQEGGLLHPLIGGMAHQPADAPFECRTCLERGFPKQMIFDDVIDKTYRQINKDDGNEHVCKQPTETGDPNELRECLYCIRRGFPHEKVWFKNLGENQTPDGMIWIQTNEDGSEHVHKS